MDFTNSDSLVNFIVRDGNGAKGLMDLGLSRIPEIYVQLPEERVDKSKSTVSEDHPIDLSKLDGPEHNQVVKELVRAAETLGFFQVVNHGVPLELLQSLEDATNRFFNQSAERKSVYHKGVSPSPLVKYGTSFAPEKEKVFEWRDYLSLRYSSDAEALEFWPEECRDEVLQYLKASGKMVRKIFEILIEQLGVKLDDAKLDELLGLKVVNLNFYPKCPNPELTIGAGRHADTGILTALLQDEIGGLYVKIEDAINGKKTGDWMEIPPIPGALVINVGDAMQILSNGKYRSAEHRVMATSAKSRVSVASFTIPKPTDKVGPLSQLVEKDGTALYREVLYDDYLNNFFGRIHQGKRSLDFVRVN